MWVIAIRNRPHHTFDTIGIFTKNIRKFQANSSILIRIMIPHHRIVFTTGKTRNSYIITITIYNLNICFMENSILVLKWFLNECIILCKIRTLYLKHIFQPKIPSKLYTYHKLSWNS